MNSLDFFPLLTISDFADSYFNEETFINSDCDVVAPRCHLKMNALTVRRSGYECLFNDSNVKLIIMYSECGLIILP